MKPWGRLGLAIGPALCLAGICLWLFSAGAATSARAAARWCVRPGGAGGCFASLQAAVDAAAPGDWIQVAAGTYSESVFITRPLTINGGWQPDGATLTETVIQADGADCALELADTGGALADLTLTGGARAGLCGRNLGPLALSRLRAYHNPGSGLQLDASGSLSLTGSLLEANGGYGAELDCVSALGGPTPGATVLISDSLATGNGLGGVRAGLQACRYHLEDNVVAANGGPGLSGFNWICASGRARGGGQPALLRRNRVLSHSLSLGTDCGALLRLERNELRSITGTLFLLAATATGANNLLVSSSGPALILAGGSWQGVNDTLVTADGPAIRLRDDQAGSGPGVASPARAGSPRASAFCQPAHVSLRNAIVWGPAPAISYTVSPACDPIGLPQPFSLAADYSLIAGWRQLTATAVITVAWGPGLRDAAPGFAGPANYRLAFGSPGLDTGTPAGAPAEDLAGQVRPQDGDGDGRLAFDLGAYEARSPRQRFLPLSVVPFVPRRPIGSGW